MKGAGKVRRKREPRMETSMAMEDAVASLRELHEAAGRLPEEAAKVKQAMAAVLERRCKEIEEGVAQDMEEQRKMYEEKIEEIQRERNGFEAENLSIRQQMKEVLFVGQAIVIPNSSWFES